MPGIANDLKKNSQTFGAGERPGTGAALSSPMSSLQTTLAHQLHVADPMLRTQIIAQQAISPVPGRRVAIGHALAEHVHAIGAPTAIDLLSKDRDEDVRVAAIRTAVSGVDGRDSYLMILRRASLDPCDRVRRLALKGLQKGLRRALLDGYNVASKADTAGGRGLVADPAKLNARIAPDVSGSGRSLDPLFPKRSRERTACRKKRSSDR